MIFIHGVTADFEAGDALKEWLEQNHPTIDFYSLKSFDGLDSFKPMREQTEGFQSEIETYLADNYYDNMPIITMVAHSQGCLLARALVEKMNSDGKFETLVLIAGPNAGVHGIAVAETYLSYICNYVADRLRASQLGISLENLVTSFCTGGWTAEFHKRISICDYWRDPVSWEPKTTPWFSEINNEMPRMFNKTFRRNFDNLKKLVLVFTYTDGVIDPVESTQFGFYSRSDPKKVKRMNQRSVYRRDNFGLKTLAKRGDVVKCEIEGVDHSQIAHAEYTFDKCIDPYLRNNFEIINFW